MSAVGQGVFLATWEQWDVSENIPLSSFGARALGAKHCYPDGNITSDFCNECEVRVRSDSFIIIIIIIIIMIIFFMF